MEFEPARIRASTAELGQGVGEDRVVLDMRLPEEVSMGELHVRVVQPGSVFRPQTQVEPNEEGDGLRITLFLGDGVPAGTYRGLVGIRLCRDIDCTAEHRGSGAGLPYEVTFTPGIQLAVTVNGRPANGRMIRVKDGAQVEMRTSVPVTWSRGGFSGAFPERVTETQTQWSARARHGNAPGSSGDFTIVAHSEELQAAITATFVVVD